VILRKDNQILLLCKGADSTIYERLDASCSALQTVTTAHLEVSSSCSILRFQQHMEGVAWILAMMLSDA